MSAWFIAGAGTDVGKTDATARLIRRLRAAGRRVRALKPVASGVAAISAPEFATSDTAVLLDASGLPVTPGTVEACTPWRFSAPLSPDMAAAAEGRALPSADVIGWCRERLAETDAETIVLIEGVGGVMSPMADDALNLDWIRALRLSTVLVGGSYLGAISHMLTARETLRADGVAVRALVLNETAGSSVPFGETLKTLRRFSTDEVVAVRRNEETVPLDLA